jgi:hypothetical protein
VLQPLSKVDTARSISQPVVGTQTAQDSSNLPIKMAAIPTEADYRLKPADIRADKCQARRLGEPDRRWSPVVYPERQCIRTPVPGSDLCIHCQGNAERYHRDGKRKNGYWHGRVTDPLMSWAHMLGTDWASGPSGPRWTAALPEVAEPAGAALPEDAEPAGAAAAAFNLPEDAEPAAAEPSPLDRLIRQVAEQQVTIDRQAQQIARLTEAFGLLISSGFAAAAAHVA